MCGPVASTAPPPTTTPSPDRAENCRVEQCELPWCYCDQDGTHIPAGLQLQDTPQMVLIMIGESRHLSTTCYLIDISPLRWRHQPEQLPLLQDSLQERDKSQRLSGPGNILPAARLHELPRRDGAQAPRPRDGGQQHQEGYRGWRDVCYRVTFQ